MDQTSLALRIEVLTQPHHGGAVRAVLVNQAAARYPSSAVDIAPKRNAVDLWVLVEEGEMLLHYAQLSLIVGFSDIVF